MTAYGSDVLGALGTLTMSIAGSEHPGEVRIRLRDGISECLVAYSARPIPAGWDVLVVSTRGPRAVEVEPWSLGVESAIDDQREIDRLATGPDTTASDTTGPDTAGEHPAP